MREWNKITISFPYLYLRDLSTDKRPVAPPDSMTFYSIIVEVVMKDAIGALLGKYQEKVIEYWKYLHMHPETATNEVETARFIAGALKNMGILVKTQVGGHGVTGLIEGAYEGPVIALRADMDALGIEEKTGLPFCSVNPGVMHACGHDAHCAILLGAAHILMDLRHEIHGAIKLVFQPAEEYSPIGGAPGMIEDGVLENPIVDAMLGLHVWPILETGTIGLQPGPVSAASDRLKIKVKGKSGHASMPHTGVDAILAASAVVVSLQQIVARNVNPRDTAVVSLCTVKGGTNYNILAEEVYLDGTVRTFDDKVTMMMPEAIRRVAENTAKACGAAAEVDYKQGYPTTLNNPDVVRAARKGAHAVVGETGLLDGLPVPAGGEDFAFFSRKVPAAFAWIGCRPKSVPEKDFPALHNGLFMPDEAALPIGVSYTVHAAFELLSSLISARGGQDGQG